MAPVELNDLAAVLVGELPDGKGPPICRSGLLGPNLIYGDGGQVLQKFGIVKFASQGCPSAREPPRSD